MTTGQQAFDGSGAAPAASLPNPIKDFEINIAPLIHSAYATGGMSPYASVFTNLYAAPTPEESYQAAMRWQNAPFVSAALDQKYAQVMASYDRPFTFNPEATGAN